MLQKYEKTVDEAIKKELTICQDIVKKVMAAIFLRDADNTQYGRLESTLVQIMYMGSQ